MVNDSNIVLASAFRLNGVNFQASAKKLAADIPLDSHNRPTKLTAIPLYYLASHAAELFLKAALLKRGHPYEGLKIVGHNLSLLLELLAESIPISISTREVIARLSKQHEDHSLRYEVLLDNGKKTYWPPLPLIFSSLDELLSATRVRSETQNTSNLARL